MRLLIYGAGVIGCLYASLFCEAGYDTTIYACGKRLESLKKHGLCYIKNRKRMKAAPRIIENVTNEDTYDFIFLTVRENQVHQALKELRNNNSPNIVTMVNTIEPYSDWEEMCKKEELYRHFPEQEGVLTGIY